MRPPKSNAAAPVRSVIRLRRMWSNERGDSFLPDGLTTLVILAKIYLFKRRVPVPIRTSDLAR